MLVNREYDVINSVRITLTFDDDTVKDILLKEGSINSITWMHNGTKEIIMGKITDIMVSDTYAHSNASNEEPGSTCVFIKVDGSGTYCGRVREINVDNILDIIAYEIRQPDLVVGTVVEDNSSPIKYIKEVDGEIVYSTTDDKAEWKVLDISTVNKESITALLNDHISKYNKLLAHLNLSQDESGNISIIE